MKSVLFLCVVVVVGSLSAGCAKPYVKRYSAIDSIALDPDGETVWITGYTSTESFNPRKGKGPSTNIRQWVARCIKQLKEGEPGGELDCEKMVVKGLD